MSSWNELKDFCEKSTRFKDLTKNNVKQYKRELFRAKIFYENNRDLIEEFREKKERIQSRYVIPYLLNLTNKISEEKLEFIQVKTGSSGGKLYASHYRNVA